MSVTTKLFCAGGTFALGLSFKNASVRNDLLHIQHSRCCRSLCSGGCSPLRFHIHEFARIGIDLGPQLGTPFLVQLAIRELSCDSLSSRLLLHCIHHSTHSCHHFCSLCCSILRQG